MWELREYKLDGNQENVKKIIQHFYPDISYDTKYVSVYVGTDEYNYLLEKANKLGIELKISSFQMKYTKSELENAQYLNMRMATYCSNFPKEYGTQYSYEKKCNCCGSGKKQISDLYIDKSKMGKKDISITYDYDVVVSERFYNLMNNNNITGLRVGNVKHKNSKMKNEPILYQLFCTNILPPLDAKTIFYKEKYCECCHKSGLHYRSLFNYKNEDLKYAMDFNYTNEYFGSGWAGIPEIIISQKVYKLLIKNKIKGLKFDIVKIL